MSGLPRLAYGLGSGALRKGIKIRCAASSMALAPAANSREIDSTDVGVSLNPKNQHGQRIRFMMVSWIMQRLQRPNLARMEWDASLQKRQLMMDQVISQDCQQTTNKKTRRKGGRIRYQSHSGCWDIYRLLGRVRCQSCSACNVRG